MRLHWKSSEICNGKRCFVCFTLNRLCSCCSSRTRYRVSYPPQCLGAQVLRIHQLERITNSASCSGTIQRNQVIYQTCTVIFHYNESDCKQLDVKNASAEINVGYSTVEATSPLPRSDPTHPLCRPLRRNCSRMWPICSWPAPSWRALFQPSAACSSVPGRITMDASPCSLFP